MNSNRHFLSFILTLAVIAFLSWGVILFAQGYRLSSIVDNEGKIIPEIRRTGMLLAVSNPEGAKLYINDELKGPTNMNVSNLNPGWVSVRIVKEGYFEYHKRVQIFEELVTEVNALLIPLSPSLSPLTYNGVKTLSLSPSKDIVVYASVGNGEPGGLWKLDFKSQPVLLASNSTGIAFSDATDIKWSPSESEILVKVNSQYYVLSVNLVNINPVPTEAEPILLSWTESTREHSMLKIEKIDIPQPLLRIATDSATLWAPNNKRFMYEAFDPALNNVQKRIFSFLNPAPVGEEIDYIAFEYAQDILDPGRLIWYGDSRHLILVEKGRISLLGIDGSNKTTVYSGDFDYEQVFARPDGGGVIILTRFNNEAPTNLYLIGI